MEQRKDVNIVSELEKQLVADTETPAESHPKENQQETGGAGIINLLFYIIPNNGR